MLEHGVVPDLCSRAFERCALCLQEGVEAHQTEADRPLTLCSIDGAGHFVRRTLNKVFQNIVEEAEHVFDELWIGLPFEEFLGVERRQAANRCPLVAKMVGAGWQNNFRAEIGLFDREAKLALVRRHGVVHRVGEEEVWFAGLNAKLEDFLPEFAGIDRLDHLA